MSGVRDPPEEPEVVGIDLKVKLPPADTMKVDRYVAKWLDDLCQIKKKQSKLSEK